MAVALFSKLELCSRSRGITGTLHYCDAIIQLNYQSEQRMFDSIITVIGTYLPASISRRIALRRLHYRRIIYLCSVTPLKK